MQWLKMKAEIRSYKRSLLEESVKNRKTGKYVVITLPVTVIIFNEAYDSIERANFAKYTFLKASPSYELFTHVAELK
jgi:hypothetical protein